MATTNETYPAKLDIDYKQEHDRVTTFFRLLWAVPIMAVFSVLTSSGYVSFATEHSRAASSGGASLVGGLAAATALMIIFRQRYPRWWFDFALELNRFSVRVFSYLFLLTDRYPSTVDKQAVHLDITYPDAKQGLNRWLPLVKWLLALPHYIVLAFLVVAAAFVTIYAWFTILFTGKYPQGAFDFVVGVMRWGMRVSAYAFLLTTDEYPPFSVS